MDSSILGSALVALITGLFGVLIALISRPPKAKPPEKVSILVPEGAKYTRSAQPRRDWLRIAGFGILFAVIGGGVVYLLLIARQGTVDPPTAPTNPAVGVLSSSITTTPTFEQPPTAGAALTQVTDLPQATAANQTITAVPIPTNTELAPVELPATPTLINKPRPNQTTTAVMPIVSPGIGILKVQVRLNGCEHLSYTVQDEKGTNSTTGQAGVKQALPVGTYDITLTTSLKNGPTRKGVVIKRDETTTVDFTEEIGQLRIEGYPGIGGPVYRLPNERDNVSTDQDQCSGVGSFELSFPTTWTYCDPVLPWPIGSCTTYTMALFPAEVRFPVTVEADHLTTLRPENYPLQLGKLSFTPNNSAGQAEIENLETHEKFNSDLNSSPGYWMPVGKYRLTLNEVPYTGTVYEFEIKAGEVTPLGLPSIP